MGGEKPKTAGTQAKTAGGTRTMVKTPGKAKRTRSGGIVLQGLRDARIDAGLTLVELSQKTAENGDKVFASTISELENMHRGAQARTVRALAAALDVSIRELRGSARS